MYREILTTPAEREYRALKERIKIEAELLDELGREREALELEEIYKIMHGETD